MTIDQLAQALERRMPGISQVVLALGPQEQQVLLSIFQDAEGTQPGSGLDAVIQTLMTALADTPQAPADGPPIPPAFVPTNAGAPLGPPGAPPPPVMGAGGPLPAFVPTNAGAPIGPPVGGPMPPPEPPTSPAFVPRSSGRTPTNADGPQPGPAQGRQLQPYPKKPDVPKFVLPEIPASRYADKKASLQRVLTDARMGKDKWRPRDTRIDDDVAYYTGTYVVKAWDGTPLDDGVNPWVHRRTTPYTFVEKVAGLVTWTNDRVEMDCPPRADDDDHKTAAQKYENWTRTSREHDSRRWFCRAEIGDPQPPLESYESHMMTLLGGLGWMWNVDPGDTECPFHYTPVPVNQIYPLSHGVTRQFCMPLLDARGEYEEIDKYYEKIEETEGLTEGWDELLEVRIICWSDRHGYQHAITWQEESSVAAWPDTSANGDKWIKEPTFVNLGFPVYNMRVWQSLPSGPTAYTKNTYTEFIGMGAITRARKLYAIVDMLGNAILMGALRALNPPTLQTHQPGTNLDAVDDVDLNPGGRNFGFAGDDVKPLVFSVTGNPDGQALAQMLIAELSDIMPPALNGAQVGNSGYQQLQATEAASATTVGPLIDALEKTYQEIFRQRGLLALRFSKNKKNRDQEMFDSYPYRGYRSSDRGRYGNLKPGDIELSGVDVEVRYTRLSTAEQAAIANMVTQLTNAHLMSVETALKKMGVREPEREWLNILKDGGMLDPKVLKGLVGAAIMGSGNQLLIQEWINAGMLDAMGGNQGSPPRPMGTPSAAAQPGTPAGGPPADVSQPGASVAA